MEIYIDDREHKLIAYIKKNNIPLKYQVKRLKVGDIIIKTVDKDITIERKTLKDLSASIKDKRIYDQIYELKKNQLYDNRQFCFIIEGSFEQYYKLQHNVRYHLLPISSLNTRLQHMRNDQIQIFLTINLLDTIEHIKNNIPSFYNII